MAKKKKQIKAGILKRKQEKKSKKKKIQKSPKKLTTQKLQQVLERLGLYIFEPEIEKITVPKERIQQIYEKNEEIPLQVMEFVDDDVYQELCNALLLILERTSNSDKLQQVCLKSTLEFMQTERYKQQMNQLVVAKYYHLLSQYQLISIQVTRDNVLQILSDYEKEFSSKLPYYQPKIFSSSKEESTFNLKQKIDTPIKKLYQDIKKEISIHAPPEKLDLILEDLEVFFEDFLPDKQINDIEKITPLLLKRFVRYVNQTLNPSEEDLKNITISLKYFREALYNLKIFDANMLNKAKEVMQNE